MKTSVVKTAAAALAVVLLMLAAGRGLRRERHAERPVLDAAVSAVVAIELEQDGRVMQLVREGERWRLGAPQPERPVRAERVEAALRALAEARAARTVTTRREEASRYGLEGPDALEIRLTLEDDTRRRLVLGAETDRGTYYRPHRREVVLMSDARLRGSVPSEIGHYLERRVFPEGTDPASIRRLVVEAPGDRYDLRYESFDSWLPADEARRQPRASEVRALLVAFDGITGEEVAPVERLQRSEPAAVVRAYTEHGRRYQLQVYVLDGEFWARGLGSEIRDGRYAVRVHPNELARVLRPLEDLIR